MMESVIVVLFRSVPRTAFATPGHTIMAHLGSNYARTSSCRRPAHPFSPLVESEIESPIDIALSPALPAFTQCHAHNEDPLVADLWESRRGTRQQLLQPRRDITPATVTVVKRACVGIEAANEKFRARGMELVRMPDPRNPSKHRYCMMIHNAAHAVPPSEEHPAKPSRRYHPSSTSTEASTHTEKLLTAAAVTENATPIRHPAFGGALHAIRTLRC
jgi:hypothetical protein